MRSVTATRYITPLREGGSMPGLVEADDDGIYVLKFRGAGQGPKALVAELVAGELALDFLPGSVTFNPAARFVPAPELAADIVWFDALVENVDRTATNPNLLVWHGALWCIDHGAALYRHHGGSDPVAAAQAPFGMIAQHVLLPIAGDLAAADARLSGRLDRACVQAILDEVPSAWLAPEDSAPYVEALTARLAAPRAWVQEAQDARG